MGVADKGMHVAETNRSVVDTNMDVANDTPAVPYHADGIDRKQSTCESHVENSLGIVEGELNPLTRRP